jgi:galactose mutarotase-like enzyme
MSDRHSMSSGALTVTVQDMGAELSSLRDAQGREFLWQAGPAWPRHAPNLFPIVGRLKDDRLRHEGRDYHLTQHGFARDRRFAWRARDEKSCRLELTDDEDTRALYPFAFRFSVGYEVEGRTLRITFTVENPGQGILPCSVGAHPAFAWPRAPGVAKEAHRIVFAEDEPEPIYQVKDGLLGQATVPSPLRGRTLALNEALFDANALIFKPPHSHFVRYEAPDGPAIEVAWEGMNALGIWSRRGGDFVCIEPWHGFASPTDFDGEFTEKPGLMHIPPGGSRSLTVTVRID